MDFLVTRASSPCVKDVVEGLPGDAKTCWDIFDWAAQGLPNDIVHDVTHPADTISDAWDAATGLF